MMRRFYLKVWLASFGILVAVMLMIRAQPYDDTDLRRLVMPEGCDMPCFMGIRPGVTTLDEAISLLQASGWTDNIDTHINGVTQQLSTVTWRWNARSPHLLSTADINSLSVTDNVVENIYLTTAVPFGEVWLTLGAPTQYGVTTVAGWEDSPINMVYDQFYTAAGLGIAGRTACSFFTHVWAAPVTVYFMPAQEHVFPAEIRYDGFFRRQVLDLDVRVCRG